MADGQAPPPPDALRDRLAIALHDNDCGDRSCTPLAMGAYYRQADTAIAVAAPVLRAEGAKTQRQHIRRIIIGNPSPAVALALIADLLDGDDGG